MINGSQLTHFRERQVASLMDTCNILVYAAGTLNEYNEADSPTYTPSADTPCGLDMSPGSRRHGADMTVIEYDATLRLAITVTVKETDHISITKRFGEAITPLNYEIMSPVQRGPSGIRLQLRKLAV